MPPAKARLLKEVKKVHLRVQPACEMGASPARIGAFLGSWLEVENLGSLSLSGMPLTDELVSQVFPALPSVVTGRFARLTVLNLSSTSIVDVAGLGTLAGLEELDLSSTEAAVQELDFRRLGRLRKLRLDHIYLPSLRCILPLSEVLQELSLKGARLRSIAALRLLGELRKLNLTGVKVADDQDRRLTLCHLTTRGFNQVGSMLELEDKDAGERTVRISSSDIFVAGFALTTCVVVGVALASIAAQAAAL